MEEITEISVFTFGDELLVELIGTDEDGEITVLTYEIEFVDAENSEVVLPKQDIKSEHLNLIEEALQENKIRLNHP